MYNYCCDLSTWGPFRQGLIHLKNGYNPLDRYAQDVGRNDVDRCSELECYFIVLLGGGRFKEIYNDLLSLLLVVLLHRVLNKTVYVIIIKYLVYNVIENCVPLPLLHVPLLFSPDKSIITYFDARRQGWTCRLVKTLAKTSRSQSQLSETRTIGSAVLSGVGQFASDSDQLYLIWFFCSLFNIGTLYFSSLSLSHTFLVSFPFLFYIYV